MTSCMSWRDWNEAAIRDKAKKLMSNRNPLKPLQFYGEAQASWVPGPPSG
jgi:hypothetical protein